MIELRDRVTIEASPETVWSWLEDLPDHLLEWHPDHLGGRWIRGKGLRPGAVMEVEEVLHGKVHRLRMRCTAVMPGRWFRYQMFPGLRGSFQVDPVGESSRFTATIEIGTAVPVVGALVDRLLTWAIRDRIAAIARHQAEEGANLKMLLERAEDTSTRVSTSPPA